MKFAKYRYIKQHKVLFEFTDGIGYEPIMYNYDDSTGLGERLSDNKMLTTWMIFLKKENSTIDMFGNKAYENLYCEQHSLAINILIDIQAGNSSQWMIAVARQFGKSKISRLITQFTFVFMPLFSLRQYPVYNIIITSYDATVTKKIYQPIRDSYKKNVELFNELFYPIELIYKGTSKKNLDDNDNHLEIGIIKNGEEEKYSQIYALGSKSENGRDSMTANLLLLDEHTKVQMFGEGNFGQSFLPMMNKTGGVLLSVGITSSDASCVGYNLYISSKVKKHIADWQDVYRMISYNSMEEAEKYKQASLNFKDLMGENSTEWLTNYMMSFDILDGKFMSPKLIKDNNLMRTVWEMPNWTNPKKYIVGGLDLSSITDRTVLSIGESELQNDLEDR